jgi:glutamate/tyrosine decarboxylase-like PLP-dependent enzyme
MNERSDLPSPVTALFPEPADRSRTDDWLTQHIAAALGRVSQGSVMPTVDMPRFRRELAALDFDVPREASELLSWTIAQLEAGTVHMTHPRYFGLFNPAPTAPSQWADRIAGAFNPQLASSGSSPVPVEIEAHVIRELARRAAMPDETVGHFTTSGSEANYTALICALTHAHPRFGNDGARAFSGPVALYVSAESHPAWTKIAHQAGVGRNALRLVATDGTGKLDPGALENALTADIAAGITPVLIVATAGTTGAGMVDPLQRCADIAAAHGIWFHVDAAWGGAALSSNRLRGLLSGIERADSITIDAHKWFATTMGCGMFLTRDGTALSEAFRVAADFMPSNATATDPYLNTVQWSRRFVGLRLFLSLGVAGWQGIADHVERAGAVTEQVKARLQSRGWTVVNDSALAVLCVVPPKDGPNIPDIVRRTLKSGRAWVARSSFEGREVIRICATHGQTSLADVDELVSVLAGDK